ncbi:hypothetical protein [Paenibacillus timonensis]|uniref:hypothetical protein n=1 Tax=Paenibacillus timonensis TaxID=225915 RepID=UPI003F9618EE
MYKYSNIICSLILSAAFLGGCYLLTERGETKPDPEVQEQTISENKSILTESELADYLGITLSDVQDILVLDQKKRENYRGSIYDKYSFLPRMELPNRSYIFLKSEIEKWVEYHSSKLN